jgi:hypothetical protein
MPTELRQGYIDHSGERSTSVMYLPDIAADGSNWAALTADTTGAGDILKAAIALVTKCNLTKQSVQVDIDLDIPTPPADESAQREVKLWVQYVDTTNMRYGEFTIPAPVDALLQVNTDEVDISANAAALALIAVLEANLVSRDDNAIQVTRMRLIRGAR